MVEMIHKIVFQTMEKRMFGQIMVKRNILCVQ